MAAGDELVTAQFSGDRTTGMTANLPPHYALPLQLYPGDVDWTYSGVPRPEGGACVYYGVEQDVDDEEWDESEEVLDVGQDRRSSSSSNMTTRRRHLQGIDMSPTSCVRRRGCA